MRLVKYIPQSRLRHYVSSFFISELDTASVYRVLPGRSLVMGFQYRGRLLTVDNSTENLLALSGITGLNDRYRFFKNIAGTGTILVYFTVTGASHFFKLPVNELFGHSLSLDTLLPSSLVERVEEELACTPGDKERIGIIESFLLACLQPVGPDELVLAAVGMIDQSKGAIRMSELAKKLYSSPSTLEKRFRKVVGASPKKYASLVRFESVTGLYKSTADLTKLGYEAGYYDQAHFIHDFRSMTGETPREYFSSLTP